MFTMSLTLSNVPDMDSVGVRVGHAVRRLGPADDVTTILMIKIRMTPLAKWELEYVRHDIQSMA